jgi:hypothetical protein
MLALGSDIVLNTYDLQEDYYNAQWARITLKLAKILTLLVLFETHIFNKTTTKISKISKKFNETNVTEGELSYSLSVLLLY